jgi:integrase
MLCCVSLFCTLRISEALALKEKHFDFDKGLILIRQSFYRGVERDKPKSKKGWRDIPMGYLKDDLKRMCTGDPEATVFRIRTAPKWGREVAYCRDDRDLNQHFLRPVAKKLKFYYPGFGFRALRREAITSIGQIAGLGEAMNAAGHAHVDTTMLYILTNMDKRKSAIEQRQEQVLGKPAGGIQ